MKDVFPNNFDIKMMQIQKGAHFYDFLSLISMRDVVVSTLKLFLNYLALG